MDEATLRRLAEVGITRLPAERLTDLVSWCWDRGETTGNAWYCSLARMLKPIDEVLVHEDEHGALPAGLAEIDAAIRDRLPAVLDADDPILAALLARELR